MKVVQPYRNVGEYAAYLNGVMTVAKLFGLKVDSQTWGGGIPMELTLYQHEEKPQTTVEVFEANEDGEIEVTMEEIDDAEPDAGTE